MDPSRLRQFHSCLPNGLVQAPQPGPSGSHQVKFILSTNLVSYALLIYCESSIYDFIQAMGRRSSTLTL